MLLFKKFEYFKWLGYATVTRAGGKGDSHAGLISHHVIRMGYTIIRHCWGVDLSQELVSCHVNRMGNSNVTQHVLLKTRSCLCHGMLYQWVVLAL